MALISIADTLIRDTHRRDTQKRRRQWERRDRDRSEVTWPQTQEAWDGPQILEVSRNVFSLRAAVGNMVLLDLNFGSPEL